MSKSCHVSVLSSANREREFLGICHTFYMLLGREEGGVERAWCDFVRPYVF